MTVDADGSFTYTPRPRDRLLADDNTTDTFTVTVSDGHATTTSTVTLPVLPADIVAGGTAATGGTPSGLAVSGGKAYVTNATVRTVSVVDLADNSVLATVPVGASPTAVAVKHRRHPRLRHQQHRRHGDGHQHHQQHRGHDHQGRHQPDRLALTPDGTRLLVVNQDAGTVTKIDTATTR